MLTSALFVVKTLTRNRIAHSWALMEVLASETVDPVLVIFMMVMLQSRLKY